MGDLVSESSIQSSNVGDHVVLAPEGPLMGGVATEILHSAVQDRIAAGEARLIVDLEQVPWPNSSGIGTLMGCRTECRDAGGDLVLASANEKIQQLLDTLNLTELLVCYASVEEATRS